jgi:hypothetical protein
MCGHDLRWVPVRVFGFGFICWSRCKHFCQYIYIGVASGIVGLYVIVNLGIGFASAVESASPPSRRTFVVNFVSETEMLLSRGYAPGVQTYLFFRVCTWPIILGLAV